MELFHRILKLAVDGGASDIHIKVGTPVVFRISRQLIAIECPFPTEEWMNKVVKQISPPHLVKRIEEEREADFSYYMPEVGRFRTNVFQQRGQWALAMRHVKAAVPSFEELGLLEQIKKIAESPRGIVLVAGATGSGLINILQDTSGNFYAASGNLTISSGAAAGNWSIYSAGGTTPYPGHLTSPAGAYWYNNAFYPNGVNPQYPSINMPLDNYGLLFTQGSNELNLWGNADTNCNFWY